MMVIGTTDLDNYGLYMQQVAARAKNLNELLPQVQEEVNAKFPKLTLEVGNGIVPAMAVPPVPYAHKQQNQILRLISATTIHQVKQARAAQPVKPASEEDQKHEHKGNPVVMFMADVAESVVHVMMKNAAAH